MIHQEIVVVHHEASCVSSQRPSVSALELIKLTFTLSLNPSRHHRSYSTKRGTKKVFFVSYSADVTELMNFVFP